MKSKSMKSKSVKSEEVRAKLRSWGLAEAPPGNIEHVRCDLACRDCYVLVKHIWYWYDDREKRWIEAPTGPM